MIYYTTKPISMWEPNIIRLDLADDLGYVYLSRNTYDQAVLIADRFEHDADLVCDKLGGGMPQEDIYYYMVGILPDPVNILAAFYNLIDKSVNIDETDLRQAIGVLSYMSMHLDFNVMTKVPREVRANLVYSKSILLEYQGHFEEFDREVEIHGFNISNRMQAVQQQVTAITPITPTQQVQQVTPMYQTVQQQVDTVIQNTPIIQESYDQDEYDAFFDGWDDDEEEEKEQKEESKEEHIEEESGTSYVKEEDELQGYDALIDRFV